MKHVFSLVLALFSLCATAQVFVDVNTAPVNEAGKSWAAAWGDYDNDGHMDLYVSNYFQKNFLYHNNGNKTFTKITTGALVTSQSIGHWSSTWVDFDDDGDLDMYVVNSYTDLNELLRNNGNGTFTNIASVITNTGATNDNNAAWVDTDNDGDLDVFLANGSNATPATRDEDDSFFINNGDGTFTQNTTSPIATDGGFSEHAAFGDYDNDNDADLFVVNTFGDSFFFENKGGNVFERVLGLPFLAIGDQPLSAVWGDFNNDKYLDLVTGSYTDSRVYYNNGNKTFHTGTLPGISGNARGVSTGDFNLDGHLDILYARTGQSPLLYINNGNETFTLTNAGALTATTHDFVNGAAVADYDNDGDLDVFIANDDSGNKLYENTEVTGNWVAFKLIGTNSNSQGIGAKVRVKTNGVWQTREVGVLHSYRTQNSVLAHFGLGSARYIEAIEVRWPSGKIQNIGRFFKINSNVIIREDLDFYDFKDAPTSALLTDNLNTRSNSWVDYDKDGDLDVLTGTVSSTSTNAINLYQNQGNNTFINKVGTSLTGFDGSVYTSTWADYDNDGDADFFTTNGDLTKPNVLYRNNNDGTLTRIMTGAMVNETTYSQAGSWADYDNDGKLDMYVANWHYLYPDRSNSLYKGDGLGGFTLQASSIFATDMQIASGRMAWSDVDDDNDIDLLVTTVSLGKSLLYRNNGDGTFSKDMTWFNSPSNNHALGVSFADYDNDGDPDVYLSGADRLFRNDGTGTFTALTGMAFDGETSEAGIWGDYDNDGDLDLYLANGGGPEIDSFYLNEGDGTFVAVNSFSTQDPSNSRSASWVDINNDQYLDLFVGNIGLNRMFINPGNINYGIQLDLKGVQSNGSGIGAKVKVRTGNKWQLREVFSQQSANLRVHFGLGDFTHAEVIRIEWSSGNVQILKNVAAGQILTITEENSPSNDLHTMANIEIDGDEDGAIALDPADFRAAFQDSDGDKLKKIKFTIEPADGTMLYDNVPMVGSPEILIADISRLKFKPDPNFSGETLFNYSAIDGRALGVTGMIEASIAPINDPPSLTAISDIEQNVMEAGGIVEIFFSVSDIDNDPEDLIISLDSDDEDFAPSANFDLTMFGNDAIYSFAIISGGSANLTVTVDDGEFQATRTFNMTINMAHTLNAHFFTLEEMEMHFTVEDFTNNFIDNENDVLSSLQITGLPEFGVLNLNSEPVDLGAFITVADLDELSYVPDVDFYGADHFSYDATDARGFAVNFTSTIDVANVDDAPEIAGVNYLTPTVRPTQTVEVEIQLYDKDSPVDGLTLSATPVDATIAPPADISFTGTGQIRTFKLKASKGGNTTVAISIDGTNPVVSTDITVLVLPNTPLSVNTEFTVAEDMNLEFLKSDFVNVANDAEGDDLVKIKITALPAHGTLKLGSTNVTIGNLLTLANLDDLTYSPAKDYNGEDTFTYDALDEFNLAGPSQAEINITPRNDAPVLSNVDDRTITQLTINDIVTADVQLTDVDSPSGSLTLTASADNTAIFIDPVTGVTGTGTTRTIHMKVTKGGVTTITLIATDGDLPVIKTFKMTVLNAITGVDHNLDELVTVYPNPIVDRMDIDAGSLQGDIGYEMIDGLGKVLKKGSVTKESVDVQDLAAGIYMMKFVAGDRIWVKKIIKR